MRGLAGDKCSAPFQGNRVDPRTGLMAYNVKVFPCNKEGVDQESVMYPDHVIIGFLPPGGLPTGHKGRLEQTKDASGTELGLYKYLGPLDAKQPAINIPIPYTVYQRNKAGAPRAAPVNPLLKIFSNFGKKVMFVKNQCGPNISGLAAVRRPMRNPIDCSPAADTKYALIGIAALAGIGVVGYFAYRRWRDR